MSRISVIVPVYKVEAWLDICVKSLVNQTFRDLEIILVDDGSPDGCPQICDVWADRDERIRVIHQQNGGLSAARNSGIRAASGELIAVIDSDDWVDPDMLETMEKALAESGADIAVCGFVHEYEDSDAQGEAVLPGEGVLSRKEALAKVAGPQGVVFIVAWNRLCRREIYDKVLFPEGKIHEDEFTAHEILGAAERIVTVNKPFYHYLHRAKSIMSNGDREEDHINNAEFLALRWDYFREHGDEDLLAPCFETFLSACTMAVRDLPKDGGKLKARVQELCRKGQEMSGSCGRALSAKEKLLLGSPFLWKTLYAVKGKLTGR
ncbi:MAG: glycosyltransferase family 2 protein [Lachnospiraceae bacterium]|nr:glycosyltransferase family 2 protein [Lachnospiraceae bacterium]